MNTEIIQSVVSMGLDATGFNDKASAAIDKLEQLKEALNFDGVVDGLSGLKDSLKNLGLEAVYGATTKASEGFNALEIVAIRTIQNIADKMFNFATSMGDEIFTKPLRLGLEEYETQINSVQTILANTSDKLTEQGLTTEHDRIEKINGVLDELNHYADMTIYNFTEMTRNIGTFTAAGVELETSATAIKGIANLAAMSGSNSNQAANAMYQLSQALSTGTVKLQDWNSVVNAGMGGKLFQNELIDTARTMGIVADVTKEVDKLDEYGNVVLDDTGQAVKKKVHETITDIDQLIEHEGSFRESLSSGWLTDEVLLTTLDKFTAGTEGYTQKQLDEMKKMWKARGYSQEVIEDLTGSIHVLTQEEEDNIRKKWADKGFSEEQINHIMEMGMQASDAATKVKTFHMLLETLGEALQSGWTQSWEYIIGDFEQAKRLWTEVSDILSMYIGKSADARNEVLKEWSRAAYFYDEAGNLVKAVYNDAGEIDREASKEIVENGVMIREEMGGRELVIQSMRNAFQGAIEVGIEFGKAWDKYFWGTDPDDNINDISITGKKLIELSRSLYDATESFKESLTVRDEAGNAVGLLAEIRDAFDDFSTNMRKAYDGIRSVFDGVRGIFDGLFKSKIFSTDIFGQFNKNVAAITDLVKSFGEAFKKHFGPDNTKNVEGITNAFNGLFNILKNVVWTKVSFFVDMFRGLGLVFEHIIQPFGTVSELLGKIGKKASSFAKAFDYMMTGAGNAPRFEHMFTSIADGINKLFDSIKKKVDFSGFSKIFEDVISVMMSLDISPFKSFEKVFSGLVNIFKSFIAVAAPVAAALANVLGDSIREAARFIKDLSERWYNFTDSLIANESTMQGLQKFFEGIFSVIKAVAEVLGTVFLAAWDSLSGLFHDLLPEGDELGKSLGDIGDKLKEFADKISGLVTGEKGVSKFSELMGNITGKIKEFAQAFKEMNVLDKFSELMGKVGEGVKRALGGTEDMSLLDTIFEKIKGFIDKIKELFTQENGEIDGSKVLLTGGIGAVIFKLLDFFKDLKDKASNLSGIFSFINDFKEIFENIAQAFADGKKLELIQAFGTSVLEVAGAMFIMAMIDAGALMKAIGAFQLIFKEFERVLVIASSMSAKDLTSVAAAVTGMGTAILEVSIALSILASMDPLSMAQGLLGVTILLGELTAVALAFSKFDKDLVKGAGSLILLAVSIDLLTIPILAIGSMDVNAANQGVGSVLLMIGAMTAAAIAMSRFGKKFKPTNAIAMILFAESIKVLAKAFKIVADIPWPDMAKGFALLGGAILGFVGVAAIIGKNKKIRKNMMILGESLMMLGVAMDLLAIAANGMKGVEWEDLGKLGAVLAGALFALGVASHFIDGKNLLMIGGAIFLVATAISELSISLNLAAVLAPLAASLAAGLNAIRDALVGIANHEAMRSFLQLLQDIVLFLPNLAIGLAKALIAMVVELGNGAADIVGALVNLAGALLNGVIELLPNVFKVISTFFKGIFQVVIDAAPKFFEMARTILTGIYQLVIDTAPKFFEMLTVIFAQLWTFLTEQIPNFFTFLTTLQTEFLTYIQTVGPMIIQTIALLLDTVLNAIILEAPKIGATLLVLLNTALTFIQSASLTIAETLAIVLLNILQTLEKYVPQMADAALGILNGFLQAIAGNIGQIVQSAADIAIAFMDGLREKMPEIVDSAFKLLIGWIDGLATAIEENHNELFDAIGHLIKAICDAIIDGITKVGTAAGDLITGKGGILESLNSFLKDMFDVGKNLVQGFINGIGSLGRDLWDAACGIANQALGAIRDTTKQASPSKVTTQMGEYFTMGFINGIRKLAPDAASSSADMALGAIKAFNDNIDTDMDSLRPMISPVINDSGIQNGISGYIGEFDNTINGTASISGTIEANNQLKHQMEEIAAAGSDYSSILDGMLELRRGIGTLGERLSNMQIVMDSGVLVGELTPGIDRGLGRSAILAGRGV